MNCGANNSDTKKFFTFSQFRTDAKKKIIHNDVSEFL